MKLNLERPLVFFDIESTGLDVLKDRIIQLAMIKVMPDGTRIEKEWLINPGIPISEEAQAVHGITVDMIRNKPSFRDLSDEIYAFMEDSDLAGYNSNRFDIPMLIEEFARVGRNIDMGKIRTVDVQRIFYKMEPRNLTAAYKFYCDKDLTGAHDALADVRATLEVLEGQIEKYQDSTLEDSNGEIISNPVKNDVQSLYEFTSDLKTLDATQRLKKNPDGSVVFNFGKYNNQPVGETMYRDQQYYQWMLKKDFSTQVKDIIQQEFKQYAKSQENN